MSDGRCIICGASDPLGIAFCTACGPSPRPDDALVFINHAAHRDDRRRSIETLATLFGNTLTPRARRRVALGGAPLIRMPRILADRAAARLDAAGLAARALPAAAAWTRMPAHFFLMIALVLLCGSFAGSTTLPIMLWTTPFFAALLALAAQEGMRRPALRPFGHGPGLTAAARTVAAAALSDLEAGETRDLLGDIVYIAQRLLASGCGLADLDDLVISAAATAREVDTLAAARAALDRGAGDDHVLTRCAEMHRSGMDLLHRALAALGSLSAAGGADSSLQREHLSGLVREMEAEAAARFAAAIEVAGTLKPA